MLIIKKKVFIILSIFICLIFLLTTSVSARDNFALAVGTEFGGINTRKDMRDARTSYSGAGFRSSGLMDPGVVELWENLYADVQFFATHGNVNHIQFANSGIMIDDGGIHGGKQYIGTNAIHWDYDTMLVTYATCNSSGKDNQIDNNSIAYKTAIRGADIVVGFRNEIDTSSCTEWSKRYNQAMSVGYGVWDASNYANSFNYSDNRVKEWANINHGNQNLKIGKYYEMISKYNRFNLKSEIKRIENLYLNRNILKNSKLTIVDDIDDISNEIKKKYDDFNKEDYEIKEPVGGVSKNVNTGELIEDDKYIDLIFKIGDFYTNAGYSIRVRDGIVKAIYDNNIDIIKQKKALLNKDLFKVNIDNININLLKEKANKEIKNKYGSKKVRIKDNLSKEDISFYYDINTGKKYICLNILSEVGEGKTVGIAYDTIKYEI